MGNSFTVKPAPWPRYLIFAYLLDKPYGGWGDFDGSFHDLGPAILHIRERHRMYDVWEIVDMKDSSDGGPRIVWKAISELIKNFGHRPRRNLVQYYPKENILECSDPI